MVSYVNLEFQILGSVPHSVSILLAFAEEVGRSEESVSDSCQLRDVYEFQTCLRAYPYWRDGDYVFRSASCRRGSGETKGPADMVSFVAGFASADRVQVLEFLERFVV